MRKWLLGALVVLVGLLPASVNAAGLAGVSCNSGSKAKQVNSVKYVCTKKGGKWKWVVKPATTQTGPAPAVPSPTVSPRPTPSAAPKGDLRRDPRITSSEVRRNLGECRAVDLTTRDRQGQGFPRPPYVARGTGKLNILVIPFSTSDHPYTDTDRQKLEEALKSSREFYALMSQSTLDVVYEVLPEAMTVRLPGTAAEYGLRSGATHESNMRLLQLVIDRVPSVINFDEFDAVLVESAFWSGGGMGEAMHGDAYVAAQGTVRRPNLIFGDTVQNADNINHELGHSLFGLEDLYIFNRADLAPGTNRQPFYQWDYMSATGSDISGWNRFLIGWFGEQQVKCLPSEQDESTYYLELLGGRPGEPQLLVLPLDTGHTLVVEIRWRRRGDGIGALVYTVDSRINHGEGPIRSIPEALSKEESITLNGYRIRVLDVSALGALVEITREM